MRVYRFFCAKFGMLAVGEHRIKISRIHLLNDPFEWAAPISNDQVHRRAFERMKSQLSKNRGVVCFSRTWRNPVMWSHYADHHHGIALGFDVNPATFFPVLYRKSRVRCDWQRFSTDGNYALGIVDKVLRSKFDHWSYEREVRSHVLLDHSCAEDGLYFLEFSQDIELKEVIVGPLCSLTRDEINSAIKHSEHKIQVTKARLAFRDYRIVQQRDASRW